VNAAVFAAVLVWVAAVSLLAALRIKSRPIALLTAAACSVGVPLVAGVLFTSLVPLTSFGPEDFLQRGWDTLVGSGAANLPWTLIAGLAGGALGWSAARYAARRRARE
jgi:hypothetical protein